MSLRVLVDGTPLPDDEATALWKRFSDWMEDHRGDLAGFAAKEGFRSVHPGVEGGKPVLFASRTEAQKPYAPVRSAGGSGSRHEPPKGIPGKKRNQRKSQ
jgi:hypothetical protein